MAGKSITNKAALTAVITAFIVGMLGTLAVRPVNPTTVTTDVQSKSAQLRLNWRVPIVFPRTMPVLGENPVYLAQMIEQASNGSIKFNLFDPGEIAPAFAITDAVRDGKVSAGYTWLGYDQGKIPSSPLISAVPFGMEPWEYSAWWFEAGGRELTENLYLEHNLMPLYCGMTGPETAGWFRDKIETLEDVRGLKIRFAGLGGKVIERLGASVTMIPGGEIFQALEKGAIDATEFALPIVDQSLGFNRVAKFNYYPGWHQQVSCSEMLMNKKGFEALPKHYQKIVEIALGDSVQHTYAETEAKNPAAMLEMKTKYGVTNRRWADKDLAVLEQAWLDVLKEEAAKDPLFKKVADNYLEFRKTYKLWGDAQSLKSTYLK